MDYVINKLEEMDKRLSAIDEELTSVTDFSVAKKLNQERALLDEPVTLYRQLKKADAEIADAQLILKDSDEEMREFAKGEIARLSALKEELNKKIELALLPKDINDEKNVIMEIRGAVGGDEGNIFAGDLYRMYLKYADKKGWKVQLLDESPTSLGGYSNVSIMIKGKGVYSRLKFESGAHRVQRVPITEKSGRIQTSTATVLVMPETEKEDIVINPSDLQVDTYRSQGAGGQNVNKTESAVRITHVPTGIVVTCQIERSQIQNREIAMGMLRAKLKAKQDEEENAKIGAERKLKVGTGERSEKIRTYNYPQNRCTDHRIGYTTNNLDRIMDGELEDLLDALQQENQKELILQSSK